MVDPVAETVRAALVADHDAGFAELMHCYHGVLYSVALRATRCPADAEDLAAESFLRAYRALRGYDTARIQTLAPRPWLLTIAVNTRRNQVRDAARRPQISDPRTSGEELPHQAATGCSVEDQVQNNALGDELGALLGRLPDTQRTAVVLRHVEDLPIAEVADVLGCPIGTAKSHISRGLRRLRAWIDESDPDRSAVSARSPR